MIKNTQLIFLALLLPILALFGIVIKEELNLRIGEEIILPIAGYDPLDPIRGRYIAFRVRYGLQACPGRRSYASDKTGYVCIKPDRFFTYQKNALYNCDLFIRGTCEGNRFMAGIERIFLPEKDAKALDSVVRRGAVSREIKVFVSQNGTARVKDLLLDGVSWRDYAK